MLSFSAIGMPCSGPRTLPAARSRSRASACSSALWLTAMTALMASSYIAMRVRYCVTISRDVVRPSFIAACISGIVASTTEKGARGASAAGGAAGEQAAVRQTRDTSSRVRLEGIGAPFGKAQIMYSETSKFKVRSSKLEAIPA